MKSRLIPRSAALALAVLIISAPAHAQGKATPGVSTQALKAKTRGPTAGIYRESIAGIYRAQADESRDVQRVARSGSRDGQSLGRLFPGPQSKTAGRRAERTRGGRKEDLRRRRSQRQRPSLRFLSWAGR